MGKGKKGKGAATPGTDLVLASQAAPPEVAGKRKGRGKGKGARGGEPRPGLLDRLTTLVAILFVASYAWSAVA